MTESKFEGGGVFVRQQVPIADPRESDIRLPDLGPDGDSVHRGSFAVSSEGDHHERPAKMADLDS